MDHRVSLFAILLIALISFAPCANAVRPMPPSPAAYDTVFATLMEMLPQGPSGGGAGH
jgi:hypothetical protein